MNNLLSTPIAIAITFCMASCSSKEDQQREANDSTIAQTDSIVYDAVLPDGEAQGDFNGDGSLDGAIVKLVKEGELHSEPWVYTIEFTDSNISPFSFSCATPNYELITEGELNSFRGDELTVVTHAGTMGTRYLQPYTFSEGVWGYAMESIEMWGLSMLPDGLGLEDAVLVQDGAVFFYLYDMDKEEYQKTKAKLYAKVERLEELSFKSEVSNEEDRIEGDFDGDGSFEFASVKVQDEDSDENGHTTFSGVIEFSDKNIETLAFTSVDQSAQIISEGDLNAIPGNELSVLTGVFSSQQSYLAVYTYEDGNWKEVLGINIPRALPVEMSLEDIIFADNGEVYFYEEESIRDYIDTEQKSSLKKIKAEINLK